MTAVRINYLAGKSIKKIWCLVHVSSKECAQSEVQAKNTMTIAKLGIYLYTPTHHTQVKVLASLLVLSHRPSPLGTYTHFSVPSSNHRYQ